MRPWDKHPPWAHWGFFAVWVIAGSLGPIVLITGLLAGSGHLWWLGLALCGVWALDLGADWWIVRQRQHDQVDWMPWEPPSNWSGR